MILILKRSGKNKNKTNKTDRPGVNSNDLVAVNLEVVFSDVTQEEPIDLCRLVIRSMLIF